MSNLVKNAAITAQESWVAGSDEDYLDSVGCVVLFLSARETMRLRAAVALFNTASP